jgi:hypothetical protein
MKSKLHKHDLMFNSLLIKILQEHLENYSKLTIIKDYQNYFFEKKTHL